MSELSRVEDLLLTGVEQPVEPMSRMEAILRGDDIKPQSRIEELLKQYDPGGGGAIELDDLSVTANGTYTPQENHAYKSVDVAVPAPPAPVLDDVTLTQNGVYTSEHDGYDEVTVAVPAPVLDTLSVTENGTYTPEHDGYSTVTVNVDGGDEVELLVDRTTTLYDHGGTTTWDAVISYTAEEMCYAEVTYYGDGYTYMWYTINGVPYNQVLSSPGRVAGVLLNPGDIIAKRVDSGGGSPYFKLVVYPATILGPADDAGLYYLIPKLTANDSSALGVAFCDSAGTSRGVNFVDRNFPLDAWHAFDRAGLTSWCNNNSGYSNAYIGYHWYEEVEIKSIRLTLNPLLSDRTTSASPWSVYTSNDGSTYTKVGEVTTIVSGVVSLTFQNPVKCTYIKFTTDRINSGWDQYVGISDISIYGEKPAQVPVRPEGELYFQQGDVKSTTGPDVTGAKTNHYYLFTTVYNSSSFSGAAIIAGDTNSVWDDSGLAHCVCLVRATNTTMSYGRYGGVSPSKYTELDITVNGVDDSSDVTIVPDGSWQNTRTMSCNVGDLIMLLTPSNAPDAVFSGADIICKDEFSNTVEGTKWFAYILRATNTTVSSGYDCRMRKLKVTSSYQMPTSELLCSGAQTVDKENWTQYYMPMDTITEGSLYDAYLSYDGSTKQFTVLQDFYGLIQCTLTNEYKAQSLAKMELRRNNSNEGYAGARWETPTDNPGSTKTRSFGIPLTTGDTFGLYTPNTDGWGFGKIKVYKVDGVDES